MLKEKINSLFKKEGNDKKKIENLFFLLVILVITVVAINYIWKGPSETKTNTNQTSNKELATTIEKNNTSDEVNLEERLETILAKLEGVGKVDVLLTYSETTEIVPVYNKTQKTTSTTEGDSGGGKRTIEESDISQEVVYEGKDSSASIAVQKQVSPKIEGAIIIAEGANNSNVKANIVQAVEAATGLATHKIQVFEKQK